MYITQLIYLKEGGEKAFLRFEEAVLPILSKYNGKLLLRIRPDKTAWIEGDLESPYEIHLIEFQSDSDFENYGKDPERKKYLQLKENAVRSNLLIKGASV